ncbi:TetR/AcrR family transcriptional regulator [Streptomyces catenulae]|uniref:TetR/AcrR family transcriptional regulator n=1 Tax=Streptomyces catenulae TaxID=66875 RepID=A0ABV2Z8P1_9ACTN|nr:TetR/AcrR family transcriptional regulator [Streptomyces catenulae]
MSSTSQRARSGEAGAAADTRERIVRSASRLFQRQGYEASGIKLIAREADATLGSVYHFFPGGKEQLAVAAIRHGEEEFADMLRAGLEGDADAARAVEAFCGELATALRKSDWADGCPVTTTALETLGRVPAIQEACQGALRCWQEVIADKLRRSGFAAEEAGELSATVLSTLEGAETLSQIHRSEQPLRAAGRHLAVLLGAVHAE